MATYAGPGWITAATTTANVVWDDNWTATGNSINNITYQMNTRVWREWIEETRVVMDRMGDAARHAAEQITRAVEQRGGHVTEYGIEDDGYDGYHGMRQRVWVRWTETAPATFANDTYRVNPDGWYTTAPPETEEEAQARRDRVQRQREEVNRRQLEAAERKKGADIRAKELLLTILSDEERLAYENSQEVHVTGSDGGLYVIEMVRSVHGNIRQVDEHGCVLGRACVAPSMYTDDGSLPLADGWVGQYLGLKFNEKDFIAKANWSGRAACRNPGVRPMRRRRQPLAA